MHRISRVRLPVAARLGTLALGAALLVLPVQAQSSRQLLVVQEPDQIVEYDTATLAVRRVLHVPRRLFEHPEYLSINGKGQMLFLPARGVQWVAGETASVADRVWYWDGHLAREWKLQQTTTHGSTAGRRTVTETVQEWFLSSDGESLFQFETKLEKTADPSGVERSVRSTSWVRRTDLAGGKPVTVANLSSAGWCACTTGACTETCPEWHFWAPDGVVDAFFLLTRVTPGQLGSTYHESLLYQRPDRTWQVTRLPRAIESPLTASENGALLVAAVPDGGCCGWENEANDRTLLLQHGKVSTLYDEFNRYDNRNYDVSFYTADARFAPGYNMLAYTVVSTARPDVPIRLSLDGRENPQELARIRRAIDELPAVEVVQLRIPLRPTTLIRRAVLVGWVSDREILVAQNGRLVVYDIRGTRRSETAIRVRSAADAFLR